MSTANDQQGDLKRIPEAPGGWSRLKWIGPGIIWMISAIATGELLFTPRIASLYGYEVLWAMVFAIFLKAMIVREIGRYAVVTGGSLLHGVRQLPGPRNWVVALIIVPQLYVAVMTIGGMAGATGTAIILMTGGDFRWWALGALAVSLALVLFGRYKAVEWASIAMCITITIALVFAAGMVAPGFSPLAAGLAPSLPDDIDYSELLPWLGFMMSGAAGMVWYSYWLVARGYGAAYRKREESKQGSGGEGHEERAAELSEPEDPSGFDGQQLKLLGGWIRVMTVSTFTAAGIVLVLLIALMVLGTELLAPEGLVPEGEEVTRVLSRLLGDVWGATGAWLLIIAAFFAFWSTIIANLDGWGRMLSQGSVFLAEQLNASGRLSSYHFYRWLYLLGLMGLAPAVLFFMVSRPMDLLIHAGIVEAIHIPVVTLSILYLNLKKLPKEVRPCWFTLTLLGVGALFFLVFAGFYLSAGFSG